MSATEKRGTTWVTLAPLLIALAVAGCRTKESAMKITSPAFADGGSIPAKYTCDGEDAVPPLAFEGVPDGAKSLALVVDDPDAPRGTWDHWIVWNIPPNGSPADGLSGRNSWNKNAWGGPCPPSGEHRYFFHLFALDRTLDLPSTAGKHELEQAMKGHVLAEAQLIGKYRRG